MSRSPEKVDVALTFAKISKTELHPLAQCVYFAKNNTEDGEHIESKSYKLLELNPVLEKTLKAGDTLYINGDPNDNSILCTEDLTFEVLNVETSNSLLAVKNLKFASGAEESNEKCCEVRAEKVFFEYLEAVPCRPQFKKVYDLLEKSVYKGHELEYDIKSDDLLDFEKLWKKSQSSKTELKQTLKLMDAIEIDGNIRILDLEYQFRVVSYILNVTDENSWDLDKVHLETTVETIGELVPKEILISLFHMYTQKSEIFNDTQLYSFKHEKICKLYAQVLLHSAGKFNLNDFLQAWQESVPEGIKTDESLLHGIALIDRRCNPNVIWSFPETKLPEKIIERFKVLFEVKDKWTVQEISPYIEKLTTDKLDVNAVLAKYTRISKQNGVKCYSSKHAK